MRSPSLSLCMIVRDEARFLPGCLESVGGVVDEMVVVDTGSTDDTIAIAEAAGARVVREPWQGDFAHARNVALAHATGDWVLLLDADERLAGGACALRAALVEADLDCGLLQLHNARSLDATAAEVLVGARAGEPILLPRLFRRVDGLSWRGRVHEDVDHWLRHRLDRMRALPVHLVHYGAVPEVRGSRGKSRRNIELLRLRVEDEPENVGAWVHLANELVAAGEQEAADEAAQRAWRLAVGQPGAVQTAHLTQAFTTLAQRLWARGRVRALAGLVDEVRGRLGDETAVHPNVWFMDGLCSEHLAAGSPRKRRWALLARAARAFDVLRRLGDSRWTVFVLPGILGPVGAVRLGSVLMQLGHFEAARQELESVVDHGGQEAALGLAECAIGLGQADRARHWLERAEAFGATPDGVTLRVRLALLECDVEGARAAVAEATALRAEPWVSRHRSWLLDQAREWLDRGGCEDVFVGGAGRSGTTLFRAMLHAHPRFHAPPELKVLPDLMHLRESWAAHEEHLRHAGVSAGDLDTATGAFVGALLDAVRPRDLRVAEKTPHNALHMEPLARALPGARFVHVVRDGRAVVASLVRQPWVDGATGEPVPFCRSVEAAAQYWAEVVQCARQDHAALLGLVLEVRFEELVAEPEPAMRRVLAFLGETWDPAVLDHLAGGAVLPDTESSSAAVARSLDGSKAHTWKSELSTEQRGVVEGEVGYLLEDLGYLRRAISSAKPEGRSP